MRLLDALEKMLNRPAKVPHMRRPLKMEGLPPLRNVASALMKNGWIQEGLAEDTNEFFEKCFHSSAGLN